MKWVFDEFDSRKDETNKYFQFIESIENANAPLLTRVNSSGSLSVIHKIDIDLTRILKANAFLLLYNLVESTVINGIYEIFNSIKSEKVNFQKITTELKRVWLNIKLNHDKTIVKDSIVSQFLILSDEIINLTIVEIEKKHIKFQGNLDASKIHELAKIYGIPNHPKFRKDTIGEAFTEIRNRRNSLAHGDLTFKECGRDFTIQQINEYKKHVVNYLTLVLENIQNYIDNKHYLCA